MFILTVVVAVEFIQVFVFFVFFLFFFCFAFLQNCSKHISPDKKLRLVGKENGNK